jgi:hypothetical protein
MEDVLFIKLQDCFSVNYFLDKGNYCINGKKRNCEYADIFITQRRNITGDADFCFMYISR